MKQDVVYIIKDSHGLELHTTSDKQTALNIIKLFTMRGYNNLRLIEDEPALQEPLYEIDRTVYGFHGPMSWSEFLDRLRACGWSLSNVRRIGDTIHHSTLGEVGRYVRIGAPCINSFAKGVR